MSNVTIYHNPRCSKSRQTLSLLQDEGIEPQIVEYLQTPPDIHTLKEILTKLGISAIDLIRKKEYKSLELPDTDNENELLQRMASHPQIIERPIVVVGHQARLGRPPEKVREIL